MRTVPIALCLLLFLLAACGSDEPVVVPAPQAPATPKPVPDHIAVDHILIGVKPAIPNGTTPEEARKLAYDLLEQLKGGADWATLKNEHSADRSPGRPAGGPYGMSNHGVRPNPGERGRDGMVPAFGDVGFTLEVGEIGMADHHPSTSPFGFHIIKRMK